MYRAKILRTAKTVAPTHADHRRGDHDEKLNRANSQEPFITFALWRALLI